MDEQPDLFEEADRLAAERAAAKAAAAGQGRIVDEEDMFRAILRTGWVSSTGSSQVAEAPAYWQYTNRPMWVVNPAHPLADGLVASSFGTPPLRWPRVRGGA